MRSLERLRRREDRIFWPTHGGPIRDPRRHLDALIQHRLARRAAVLAALTARPAKPIELVDAVYPGLDPRLRAAAAESLRAHLIELGQAGEAEEIAGAWRR